MTNKPTAELIALHRQLQENWAKDPNCYRDPEFNLSYSDIHKATADRLAEQQKVIDGLPVWGNIVDAPRYEKEFLCRDKCRPHITFVAAFFKESESWEMPQEYDVLHNMTQDIPLDDDIDKYEWAELPKALQPKTEVE